MTKINENDIEKWVIELLVARGYTHLSPDDQEPERPDLTEAVLVQANLKGATLKGARLAGAQITGARLCGADLRETGVTSEQIEFAAGDAQTKLPKGVARPRLWPNC